MVSLKGVIPCKRGIQRQSNRLEGLDSRFNGNDKFVGVISMETVIQKKVNVFF
jgi:hypothetical protein